MTKQDSAMEQPTSQPQTSGETASRYSAFNPTDVSRRAELRRAYKKLFGYKPVGVSEVQLERRVAEAQLAREQKAATKSNSSQWKDGLPEKNYK